jgi:hypothetical protein
MDNIALFLIHKFLAFFYAFGMNAFVLLFDKDADYCATGIDRYSSVKSLVMCQSLIWCGYLIMVALLVVIIYGIRFFLKKQTTS